MNDSIILQPALYAEGNVQLPGSKSISNRVLLLAALASGKTFISNLLESDDTHVMLNALTKLGVKWSFEENESIRKYCVEGINGHFPVKEASLFMGNAGTAIRPVTAALAIYQGHYQISGVERMHQRPIGNLVDALRQLGADIRYLGEKGFPPLEINPAILRIPNEITINGSVSSQFLTSILMSLPLLANNQVSTNRLAETNDVVLNKALSAEFNDFQHTIEYCRVSIIDTLISRPYINITLNLLKQFGIDIVHSEKSFFDVPIKPLQSPGNIFVEGDASTASYFLAAGVIGGGPVCVQGVGQNSCQGDIAFLDALAMMGAEISKGPNWLSAAAPIGGKKLRAIDIDCNAIPDAAMTLAIVALFAQGKTCLSNIASWRVKETDRIAAMATELRKLGAQVEEGEDWITVSRSGPLKNHIEIDTYDDHRMAMCFSLVKWAGLTVIIKDPQCVSKTFPNYFEYLAAITKH